MNKQAIGHGSPQRFAVKLIKEKRNRLMRLREQGLISHKVQQGLIIEYAQFVCRFFGC